MFAELRLCTSAVAEAETIDRTRSRRKRSVDRRSKRPNTLRPWGPETAAGNGASQTPPPGASSEKHRQQWIFLSTQLESRYEPARQVFPSAGLKCFGSKQRCAQQVSDISCQVSSDPHSGILSTKMHTAISSECPSNHRREVVGAKAPASCESRAAENSADIGGRPEKTSAATAKSSLTGHVRPRGA